MRRQWIRALAAVSGLLIIAVIGRPCIMRYGLNGVSYITALAYACCAGIGILAVAVSGLYKTYFHR